MKILLINKYLYNRGGDYTYIKNLGDLLIKNNHSVIYWGMNHPNNPNYDNNKYFVDYIDYPELLKEKKLSSLYKTLKRSIYSSHAKKKLTELIQDHKPDIAHLGNIHSHLTPSIIDVLNENNIPIIWTLHDFELLCPNIHFISNGKICEDCKVSKYYMCSINKCKKGSLPASIIASIKSYVHYFMYFQDKVDFFITPSDFMRNKFIDYGWDQNKLIHMQNFLTNKDNHFLEKKSSNKYIVYFGGLSPWKGVGTLIKSIIGLEKIKLIIMGDGELRSEIVNSIENIDNIEYIGFQKMDKLRSILSQSLFVVVPSECYENCPYSILEAMSMGIPTIASNIGGIPELVLDGKTGLLFEQKNVEDLQQKIQKLYYDNSLREKLSNNAYKFAVKNFNSDKYLNKLLKLYTMVNKQTN